MTLRIYIEQKFASLQSTSYQFTVKVNENNSLITTYKDNESSWQRKYDSLEELLIDSELAELWKWIAKGLTGIPNEIKK
ncbi:MAG: hypothetical protein ACRD5H_10260 [Nitrososphaerales archaeon]